MSSSSVTPKIAASATRLSIVGIAVAKYFGVFDRNFLNMQNDIDVRELKQELVIELAAIPVLMQE